MLVKVSFLREGLFAIVEWTYKGSFTSMHPKVIEEIVPLSKVHFAELVIALEYFYGSMGSRVLVLEDSESFGFRDGFLNFKFFDVIMFTFGYFYLDSTWNLFSNIIVHDVLLTHDLDGVAFPQKIIKMDLLRHSLILKALVRIFHILAMEYNHLWLEYFSNTQARLLQFWLWLIYRLIHFGSKCKIFGYIVALRRVKQPGKDARNGWEEGALMRNTFV